MVVSGALSSSSDGDDGSSGGGGDGDGDGGKAKITTLPVWHKAKDNQTPRDIAKILGVDVKALIFINQKRYPTLAQSSRLRGGTQLRVPRREGEESLDDGDAWRMDPDVVVSARVECAE